MIRAWVLRCLLACLLTLAAPLLRAQDVLPVPALSGRVIDQTGTLSEAQRGALEAKLAAFEASAGSQLVVLMVSTTQPEDIASFAQRVGDAWKIGRRNVGDGVLLVVAKGDRHVRIEVAKTLEGAVPDLAARQIIDSAVRPAFRANDYAGGLNAAVDQLSARISKEGLPSASTSPGEEPGLQWEELGIFLFFGVPFAGTVLTGMFGRKLGSLVTAAGAGGIAWWFTASMVLAGVAAVGAMVFVGLLGLGAMSRGATRGRGGSWGGGLGGGGGGGFSSGGGGDFGGGGASGDW